MPDPFERRWLLGGPEFACILNKGFFLLIVFDRAFKPFFETRTNFISYTSGYIPTEVPPGEGTSVGIHFVVLLSFLMWRALSTFLEYLFGFFQVGLSTHGLEVDEGFHVRHCTIFFRSSFGVNVYRSLFMNFLGIQVSGHDRFVITLLGRGIFTCVQRITCLFFSFFQMSVLSEESWRRVFTSTFSNRISFFVRCSRITYIRPTFHVGDLYHYFQVLMVSWRRIFSSNGGLSCGVLEIQAICLCFRA